MAAESARNGKGISRTKRLGVAVWRQPNDDFISHRLCLFNTSVTGADIEAAIGVWPGADDRRQVHTRVTAVSWS